MSVTQAEAKKQVTISSRLQDLMRTLVSQREFGVFVALVVFFSVMYVISPTFRLPYNLKSILKQISVTGIVAMGQTLVVISGAFDLSAGPVAALVGMITGIAWHRWGFHPVAAMGLGLALGAVSGWLNGVLAARLRLHPIVMTLATGAMFTGVNYFSSEGRAIVGLPPEMVWLGQGNIRGVPVLVIILFTVTILMHIVLTRTLFGHRVLMIGGNVKAAGDIGLDVEKLRIGIFTISGFLSGLGGVVLLGRVGNAVPQAGQDMLFPVVTATIVGGTLLSGGVGSMAGTLMGAAIMGIVRNSLAVLQANIYLQDFFQGALVVGALVIDVYRRGELTWDILIGRER
jgi:ribose transport system permease protein